MEETTLLDILDMEVLDVNNDEATIRELLMALTPKEKAKLKKLLA